MHGHETIIRGSAGKRLMEVNAVARVTGCKTFLIPLDQLLHPNDAPYRATVTLADVPLHIILVLMQ